MDTEEQDRSTDEFPGDPGLFCKPDPGLKCTTSCLYQIQMLGDSRQHDNPLVRVVTF